MRFHNAKGISTDFNASCHYERQRVGDHAVFRSGILHCKKKVGEFSNTMLKP